VGLALIAVLCSLASAQNTEPMVALLRSVLALEHKGCSVPLPHGFVRAAQGGQHRRTQIGGGGMWGVSSKCNPAALQARAADVDKACCPNDSCKRGGMPSKCGYRCAVHLVPFYADCGKMLASMGQNLAGLNAKCTPDKSMATLLRTSVRRTKCTNPILSCHHPGGVTCIDASHNGGSATGFPSQGTLAECSRWTSEGGGWIPSAETCDSKAFVGNLVQNGNFERPLLSEVDAAGSKEYRYVWPAVHCKSGCQIGYWQFGETDVKSKQRAHVVLAANGNRPWGGLNSLMGKQYLVLQGRGTYAEQTLHNLKRGNVYELRLRYANRPGYGNDERLLIKMDVSAMHARPDFCLTVKLAELPRTVSHCSSAAAC
jgi:hypothetical protein